MGSRWCLSVWWWWCAVVNSGKWLVGPCRTSNCATCFFISLGDTGRCSKVSLAATDESGQRRARTRAPKSGRTLRFIRVNVVVYQSFSSVSAFGAFLALKLSRSQQLSQGTGAVHSQHLSLHVDGARRTPKIFLYDWRGTATITMLARSSTRTT